MSRSCGGRDGASARAPNGRCGGGLLACKASASARLAVVDLHGAHAAVQDHRVTDAHACLAYPSSANFEAGEDKAGPDGGRARHTIPYHTGESEAVLARSWQIAADTRVARRSSEQESPVCPCLRVCRLYRRASKQEMQQMYKALGERKEHEA